MELEDYRGRCRFAELTRDDAGVLTVRLHRRGGSLIWTGGPHRELPELFAAIASDRANKVIVLTGSGDTFIGMPPAGLAPDDITSTQWDRVIFEGLRLVQQLLDIEVPMIAAVNGPATAHSELAVLCDVVLAAEHAYFEDAPHIPGALVPGDSMQIIWPLLLGPNAGRYFLLTGRQISAAEAHDRGVVAEVLPAADLLPRAHELAARLAALNPVLLRNTRHVFTRPLRRAMLQDLHVGLAVEAVAALAGQESARSPAR